MGSREEGTRGGVKLDDEGESESAACLVIRGVSVLVAGESLLAAAAYLWGRGVLARVQNRYLGSDYAGYLERA